MVLPPNRRPQLPVSCQQWRTTDSFSIGNGLNLAGNIVMLMTSIGLLAWLKVDNKRRDKVDVDMALDGMTVQEIQALDWKHPGWRWRL